MPRSRIETVLLGAIGSALGAAVFSGAAKGGAWLLEAIHLDQLSRGLASAGAWVWGWATWPAPIPLALFVVLVAPAGGWVWSLASRAGRNDPLDSYREDAFDGVIWRLERAAFRSHRRTAAILPGV